MTNWHGATSTAGTRPIPVPAAPRWISSTPKDARYVDPLAVADGREAIASMIGAVQQQFPGLRFRLAGPVDGHHNQARFGWELGPAGGEAPIVGFDVAVTDDDGRISTVLGFLDKVPSAG